MTRSRSVHPLCLAIPLLLAPSAIWIARDHSVWPWDQAWYAEVSVNLWYTLTHPLRAWVAAMLMQLNSKPPGIVWLGQFFVPLRHILGSVENALLASILFTEAILLVIVYRIGRLISPEASLPALAGVVFTAATQAFVGLSEQFFVEPLQAVAVAWVLFIALRSREWPTARTLIHLAAALLLGALAKATTPVYCFVFCLYAAPVILRRPFKLDLVTERRLASSRWLMLAFVAILPATAAWYAINLKYVWEHIRLSSSGEVALEYGFRASVGQKLVVWAHLLRESFLAPFLLWVLVAALLLACAWRLFFRGAMTNPAKVAAALGALQIAAVLFLFSRNDAVGSRYLFPLIVSMAALFMACCSIIRSRVMVAVLLLACGVQWAAVHRFALGSKNALGESQWITAPQRDRLEYDEMTRAVQLTSIAPPRYNIVGVEEPWLNANSAAFFAAKNRLDTGARGFYTSLGYAEKDTAAALRRLKDLRIQYFITLDEPYQTAPPDFLNVVSLPVLRQLKQDPGFHQVPFPSRKGIVILKATWTHRN
jgi:hypothetical protein